MQLNLNNLTDEQFNHLLELLILYKQTNKEKEVFLNEKCIKEAFYFMNSIKNSMGSQLDMN